MLFNVCFLFVFSQFSLEFCTFEWLSRLILSIESCAASQRCEIRTKSDEFGAKHHDFQKFVAINYYLLLFIIYLLSICLFIHLVVVLFDEFQYLFQVVFSLGNTPHKN